MTLARQLLPHGCGAEDMHWVRAEPGQHRTGLLDKCSLCPGGGQCRSPSPFLSLTLLTVQRDAVNHLQVLGKMTGDEAPWHP